MKMKMISAALLATLSFVSASAFADTYSVTIAGTPSGPTDLSSAVSFAGFNSALGTLTGVTITLDANVTGTVFVNNFADDLKSGTVSLNALLGFSTGSVAQTFYTGSVFSQTYSLDSGEGTVLGGTKLITGSTSYSSGLNYFTTASVAGTAGVKAVSFSSGGEDVDTYFVTTALTGGTVTYNYTAAPVPEPETYGMMLVGLGLMGVVARRKSANGKA